MTDVASSIKVSPTYASINVFPTSWPSDKWKVEWVTPRLLYVD